MELLLGFMTAAWLFTVLGGAYVAWRYVYSPWRVVRADLAALAQDVRAVQAELKLRKALYLGDEELARLESREAVRRALARELRET